MGTDTIAAIATAMTSSGIGIVRISGDEAVSITDRIFEMKNQKKLEDMPTHTIHYGHIHDGDEVIDEVMVVLMREPKSYTREDTVENTAGDGEDTKKAWEILREIARARSCLLKGSELDTKKAAGFLLDDFRSGKLGRITLQPPPEDAHE